MTTTPRERLPRRDAEQTYLRAGELAVYRQLLRDAADLDASLEQGGSIAVGPFARLRTDIVVDQLGKTRGAINNLWGSQAGFREAIFDTFLNDTTLGVEDVAYPDAGDCADLDEWIRRWAEAEYERGPRHGGAPENRYGLRWAAWLALVPYGIWSERVAGPSMREYRDSVAHTAAAVLAPALEHFGLRVVAPATLDDLAVAAASAVEGFWLNASLTDRDPIGRDATVVSALATTLRLLVRGATTP